MPGEARWLAVMVSLAIVVILDQIIPKRDEELDDIRMGVVALGFAQALLNVGAEHGQFLRCQLKERRLHILHLFDSQVRVEIVVIGEFQKARQIDDQLH